MEARWDEKKMNREEELERFIQEYSLPITKKKRRKLLELSDHAFFVFQVGIEIAVCCKVSNYMIGCKNH